MTESIELPKTGPAPCCVVLSRGGEDKPKVIFRRGFVGLLLEKLRAVDASKFDRENIFKQLARRDAHKKFEKMVSGVFLEEIIDLGVFLTANASYRGPNDGPWCWLTVSLADSWPELT